MINEQFNPYNREITEDDLRIIVKNKDGSCYVTGGELLDPRRKHRFRGLLNRGDLLRGRLRRARVRIGDLGIGRLRRRRVRGRARVRGWRRGTVRSGIGDRRRVGRIRRGIRVRGHAEEIFRSNPDGLQGKSTQYGGKKTG